MTPRVATAPCSFGVFENTVDGRELPSATDLVAAMARCGYAGTELGPPGYLGDGGGVAELLGRAGLELVGSFLPFRFSRAEAFAEELRAMDETLDLLLAAAGGREPPVLLLSDAFVEPDRLRYAGRIDRHPETWLSPARAELLVSNLHRAAERAAERGFRVALHYHAGTYVETEREIEAVAAAMDTALLGLCLDSGHAAFAGLSPIALLEAYGDLVTHVHLKDVDVPRLRAIQAAGGGLEEAWEEGVFCRIGSGAADVGGLLDALEARGYDGWLVVEQDRLLPRGHGLAAAEEDARLNREFLAARGV